VAAAGRPRATVTRTFPVEVSDGRLLLEFLPSRGEAVVSTLSIRRQ
jgi:hypothetical protein